MGNFVEKQKAINVQTNQKIETVESSLNKKLDSMHYELQSSITRLSNQQQGPEKGKFPFQTQQNPRGIHEISSASDPNARMDEVKAIITLRSGKEIEQPVPKIVEETRKEKEAEPERIIIRDDSMKKNMPPPFPQALRGKKKFTNQTETWEVLRQVMVNIPLLDMIKQVPTYAKFLKDLCTVKRGLGIEKKAFLT